MNILLQITMNGALEMTTSGSKVILKDNKTKISSEYYWITNKDGESVVFYKN